MAMPDATAIKIETPDISYLSGVLLVLMAGVFWSSMGLGIRNIEVANVWQILFYRSWALGAFLFILITFRSGYKPIITIRKAGVAGAIGGIGCVTGKPGNVDLDIGLMPVHRELVKLLVLLHDLPLRRKV